MSPLVRHLRRALLGVAVTTMALDATGVSPAGADEADATVVGCARADQTVTLDLWALYGKQGPLVGDPNWGATSRTHALPTPLPPGRYQVYGVSEDNLSPEGQEHEQWAVEIGGAWSALHARHPRGRRLVRRGTASRGRRRSRHDTDVGGGPAARLRPRDHRRDRAVGRRHDRPHRARRPARAVEPEQRELPLRGADVRAPARAADDRSAHDGRAHDGRIPRRSHPRRSHPPRSHPPPSLRRPGRRRRWRRRPSLPPPW